MRSFLGGHSVFLRWGEPLHRGKVALTQRVTSHTKFGNPFRAFGGPESCEPVRGIDQFVEPGGKKGRHAPSCCRCVCPGTAGDFEPIWKSHRRKSRPKLHRRRRALKISSFLRTVRVVHARLYNGFPSIRPWQGREIQCAMDYPQVRSGR